MTRQIQCFLSSRHPCGYLPEREAASAFIDPQLVLNDDLYGQLCAQGFRRSGSHVYRPHCPACQACIPVRIPVAAFRPDRNQRRTVARNRDLEVTVRPATFIESHYRLFLNYLEGQHPRGGMNGMSRAEYEQFLHCPGIHTHLHEFREHGRLCAVAVADSLADGMSAVYTFYDPARKGASPGTFAILHLIRACHDAGLRWLYLGYWIETCRKMNYKTRFRPCEILVNGVWRNAAEAVR